MSGIHFLGEDDFIIKQGDKGTILSLVYDTKGITLVLFYSTECPYCDALINKFKMLPTHLNGCQFAMINVNRNMNIVERSKNTIAPITYVPDLILYVNGFPYVRYDGPHSIQHISEFIVDISMKIQNTAFMNQKQELSNQEIQLPPSVPKPNHIPQTQNIIKEKHTNIPAYTIGTPLYGEKKRDGVCYLDFNSAYVSSSNKM